jgi:hypothetical protein
MEHKHPEAEANYRRCCRLMGEWAVSARPATQENLRNRITGRPNAFKRARGPFPPEFRVAETHRRTLQAGILILCHFSPSWTLLD